MVYILFIDNTSVGINLQAASTADDYNEEKGSFGVSGKTIVSNEFHSLDGSPWYKGTIKSELF